MSRLGQQYYQKKLRDLLSKAPDEAFIQLIWAIDALQSGREQAAENYLIFPREAATDDITSKYAIHKWELETLLFELLTTPKAIEVRGVTRTLNCGLFQAGATAVNFLRSLENAEAGLYLKEFGIFSEMDRIGHRQFAWQRGFYNAPQFYRYAYIYARGECASYFQETNGITIDDFSLVGFAFQAGFRTLPGLRRNYSMHQLGVSDNTVALALKKLSASIEFARAAAVTSLQRATRRHGGRIPTAYRPSGLRQFPIIAFGENDERLLAPIPELISLRITAGLFYDVISGPTHLRNEASKRFETYSLDYISAMAPRFSVSASEQYRHRGQNFETPDIRISDKGAVVIAVECKATKLSFDAQFADDPLVEVPTSFGEIAKGVFQLWRYFSHVRRSVVDCGLLSSNVHGVVLTLDGWRVSNDRVREWIIATATELARSDVEITADDRREVVICAIDDWESSLSLHDEDGFLSGLTAAQEAQYHGWHLRDILRTIDAPMVQRPFPFSLHKVLPWWQRVEEMAKRGAKGKR